jgi:hypothetical protein
MLFKLQDVVCRFFERAAGKVPRSNTAKQDASKHGDGKPLPLEDSAKSTPGGCIFLRALRESIQHL